MGETRYAVVNIDKLTYAGKLESLAALVGDPRYSFEQVDICDGPAIATLFSRYRPCGIIHLAAESHVDRSIGTTKLAGERADEEVGGGWLVLRTSWVYGLHGQNFLRSMLRLAREHEEIQVVNDQIGAPTWSRIFATATAQILAMALRDPVRSEVLAPAAGIYHLTAAGQTTWCEFARAILARDPARAEQRARAVVGIATSEYSTAAERPRWSVLDGAKVASTFGIRLPQWNAQLDLVLG